MAEIIGIRFKREGKQYYFDPQGITVEPGMGVILETSWGIEFGECVRGNSEVPDEKLVAPLRPILRLATTEDYEIVRKNRSKEADAFSICQKKIQEHELDMKLVDVEFSFEGNKILFFFTSEGRVDFRGLVKDLASIFHNRIELRQIGVRDEAKMLGGLGICGRPFCCASFLREFQPVSIKMAKTQSLSLNPTKISGTCGRLMCCLKYEQDAYEDLLKTSPKADSFVETPDGVGDIISVNTLREKVRVRLDNAPDTLKTFHNSEIRMIRAGKGKRPEDYHAPSPEELEKLRQVQKEVVEETNRSDSALAFSARRNLSLDPTLEMSRGEQSGKAGQIKKEEKRQTGKGPDRKNSYHHQGARRDRKPEKEQKAAINPLPNVKNETEPPVSTHTEHGGKQQARRHTKVTSQPAIEKALPREKPISPKEADGGKKAHRPYWRRKPSQPSKKPREGGSE
ncbi:MAG: Signal peptidase-like protein [Evtepia sp.]|jgi:cell fate regulator YaaT (PSP1 superfamily)|nr:Signal peptidase-like protein [Evtepia sp.]